MRLRAGEALGVGDAGARQRRRLARAQRHAGHHHRAEDRAAAGFVDAEDQLVVDDQGAPFERESSAIASRSTGASTRSSISRRSQLGAGARRCSRGNSAA